MSFLDQGKFDVRCEWGLQAIDYLAPADIVVIVDVLSFTTSVEIATSRGAGIFPYQWRDDTAAAYAAAQQAELASTRDRFGGRFSLSPSSLTEAPASLRLVLPSPNGSTLTIRARETGAIVVAGCLRNATAVGNWLQSTGKTISVVAAGERWPDGTTRYAIEDLIGAGAILRCLRRNLSPEARLAIAAFEKAEPDLPASINQASSGRELLERGFAADVDLAAALDVSEALPILDGDCFVAQRR
jgi:2-phosphosulfolactate phosphatase